PARRCFAPVPEIPRQSMGPASSDLSRLIPLPCVTIRLLPESDQTERKESSLNPKYRSWQHAFGSSRAINSLSVAGEQLGFKMLKHDFARKCRGGSLSPFAPRKDVLSRSE